MKKLIIDRESFEILAQRKISGANFKLKKDSLLYVFPSI
jgi:hypothetical protein